MNIEKYKMRHEVNDDDEIANLLAKIKSHDSFLQRFAKQGLGTLARRALFVTMFASAIPEKQGLPEKELESANEILDKKELFYLILNQFDAPDYYRDSEKWWEERLNFEYKGREYNLSRRDLNLILDHNMVEVPYKTFADGDETRSLADVFPEYTYQVPLDPQGENWQTNINAFALDVMYKISIPDSEKLLDIASDTKKEERKELGRILSSDSYAFLPEGVMVSPDMIVKLQRVGEQALSQYLPEEDLNAYMLRRFEDSSELALVLMREVEWQKLTNKQKLDFRALVSWMIRAEMNFSADFVQIADHTLYSDQADKEAHLFEDIESWDGKNIKSVMNRMRETQYDFQQATGAYLEFIDKTQLDDKRKDEIKTHIKNYRKKITRWQNDQLDKVFNSKIDYTRREFGKNSEEAIKWMNYKYQYLDSYKGDAS